MEKWVCDYCGQTGDTDDGETTDQVLCHTCGEPVLPHETGTTPLPGSQPHLSRRED